jgi:hypothetical protein
MRLGWLASIANGRRRTIATDERYGYRREDCITEVGWNMV